MRVRALALATALLARFEGPAAAEPAELRMLLEVARDFEAPVASVRARVGAGGAQGENDAAEVRSALGAVELRCGR